MNSKPPPFRDGDEAVLKYEDTNWVNAVGSWVLSNTMFNVNPEWETHSISYGFTGDVPNNKCAYYVGIIS